ncbi:uncharacterized protein LOC141632402 [Silene latifolia]|uniref:uncharacterized protein LOC141632402 n=1 Tax=Silene latifolia TaxID=37657 RepID=UPI003D776C0A
MRQRRWLELLNDYKVELQYHEGKANVVADVLGRMVCHAMRSALVLPDDLSREFQKMSLEVVIPGTLEMSAMVTEPEILQEIRVKQIEDEFLEGVRVAISEDRAKGFDIGPDDGLQFQATVLVAEYEEGERRVCESLPDLSEGQVRTLKTWWSTATIRDSHMEMGVYFDGFHHGFAEFWKKLQLALGSELKMSTAFHAAIDGQTERTIQTLEDMLRVCALEFQLHRYRIDPSHVLQADVIEFEPNMTYEERPVLILEC